MVADRLFIAWSILLLLAGSIAAAAWLAATHGRRKLRRERREELRREADRASRGRQSGDDRS